MAPKTPPIGSIQELAANARRLLQERRYKDAIAALKNLLKRERTREREAQLAEAYLGRAREVAAKGMFQEAAVLWENHAGFHPGLPVTAEYLDWLSRAGQAAKLCKALAQAPADLQEGPEGRRFIEGLALRALDNPALLTPFPAEHAVARQQPLLRQAVLAYAAGRDDEVEDCLRQVSSRSPYRNLRILLKSLLILEQDRAAALELLTRIEADSPCREVALALAEAPDTVTPLALGPRLQAVVDQLRGWDKARRTLLRDLRQAGRSKAPRKLLEQLVRHQAELGSALCRRYAQALLPGCPDAMPIYERSFGALTAFDRARYKALHAEARQDYPTACQHWEDGLAQLRNGPAAARDPLTEALIYRHMASLAEHDVPDIAMDYLAKSLEQDPQDKPSYLALIRLSERQEDPKTAQVWVERALRHYPGDPEALLLAMQSAHRRKAYKQVAAHARTLLAIDPINSQARRYLLAAHLAHARKLLKSQRAEAAEKELAEARRLDPQRRNPALPYLEGLLAYLLANNEECRVLWREGWQRAGGDAEAWLRWAMEVQGAGLPITGPGMLLDGLDKKHVASKTELANLVRLMDEYGRDSRKHLDQALKTLNAILKRSFKQSGLSVDDYAGYCQALADAAQWDLLEVCAGKGLRVSIFGPLFQYYEVLARCRGNPRQLSFHDENRLQFAIGIAHNQGDKRAVALIEGILRRREALFVEDFDHDLDERLGEQFRELEKLSPDEQIEELMKRLTPMERQGLTPENAPEILLGKLLEGLDIDPNEVFGGPGTGGARRSSRKSR